jgi:arylformamidase
MTIIDISPVISHQLAVWPGDQPLRREILLDIQNGDHIDLSSYHGTVHMGAHADAPIHYDKNGASIDEVSLTPYLGPCYVHSVKGKTLIDQDDCLIPLRLGIKRVLFHTGTYPDPHKFHRNFCAISPQAIETLGENGVLLIGIDTPSIDPFDSKDLPAHHSIFKYDMRNLEGLILRNVPDGHYELIALPLPLKGFDASPVRAVLRTL